MRAAVIALAVVGAILLLGGIAALTSSFQPLTDSATITIPSGAQWYYAYDFSLLANGHVSGSFQERTGGSVDVYVLTDAQYKVYDGGGSPQPLFSTAGSSGQLDVALPGSDTFHLVFDHGAGYDAVQQDVDVVITVSGIGPPTYVIAGVVALGIGTVLIAIAAWKERRDKRAPRSTRTAARPGGCLSATRAIDRGGATNTDRAGNSSGGSELRRPLVSQLRIEHPVRRDLLPELRKPGDVAPPKGM